jgi:hypothetical protein
VITEEEKKKEKESEVHRTSRAEEKEKEKEKELGEKKGESYRFRWCIGSELSVYNTWYRPTGPLSCPGPAREASSKIRLISFLAV